MLASRLNREQILGPPAHIQLMRVNCESRAKGAKNQTVAAAARATGRKPLDYLLPLP